MMIVLGIVIAFVIFSVIILIHEYGHFSAARKFGVKVEEFGLGIPPKAKKLFTDSHGTQYTLNWLPIGGFVRLKGENALRLNLYDHKKKLLSPDALTQALEKNTPLFDADGENLGEETRKELKKQLKNANASDALHTKPAWQQSIVMLAGVAMNFLLAIVIFWILFMFGIKPVGINTVIQTDTSTQLIPTMEDALQSGFLEQKDGIYMIPLEESIAKSAGILEYDLLTHINGEEMHDIEHLQETFRIFSGQEITLTLQRAVDGCDVTNRSIHCDTQPTTLSVTPSTEGKIGTYIFPNIVVNEKYKIHFGPIASLGMAVKETYGQITLTLKGLKMILGKLILPETPTERQEALDQVSGPIGMVNFMTQSLGNGIVFLIIIGAIISINLGVFNLLPLPALDGGRFFFIMVNTAVKKLCGKKAIPEHIEGLIHVGFFLFLIFLSVLIAYNDIYKIVTG